MAETIQTRPINTPSFEEAFENWRATNVIDGTNAVAQGGSAPVLTPSRSLSFEEAFSQWKDQSRNAPPSSVSVSPNLSVGERNQRRGQEGEFIPVQLEDTADLGFWTREAVATEASPQDKLAVLQKLHPELPSRIIDTGDIVIEIPDSKTGKTREVALNPEGLDRYDLLDLAVHAPAIAASIATAIATKGIGAMRTVGQIISSSLAGAGTDAAQKGVTRGVVGVPVRPNQILKDAAGQAALDAMFQGTLSAGAKALGVLSPWAGKPSPMKFNQQKGIEFIKDNIGVDLTETMTPAQITGSRFLARVEAAESPQPGASSVLESVKRKQEDAVKMIQDIALGNSYSSEAAGEGAISSIKRSIVDPIEDAVSKARENMLQRGQLDTVKLFDKALGSRLKISQFEGGEVIRNTRNVLFAQAKGEVDELYSKIHKMPGGSGDVIPADAIANAAREIRKDLPSGTVPKPPESTGLFDEFGNELMSEGGEQTKILNSGVPSGLLNALSDMESLRGGRTSLQSITAMKNAAYDEIAKTQAVPGVKERWFNKIAAAYEEGLQKGIDEIQSTDLKAALTKARKAYKEKIVPFERKGLNDIQRSQFESGFVPEERLVRRVIHGDDAPYNFRVLKDLMSKDPTGWKTVRRVIGDTIMNDSVDVMTGRVNPAKLLGSMESFAKDNPQLFDEIFGAEARPIALNAETMRMVMKSSTLDPSEVRHLLVSENVNANALRTVLAAERVRAEVYVNGIIKDVADGLPIASKIKPTEFVDRVLDLKTPSKDVQQVLAAIAAENPAKRDAISSAVLYRVFDEAETARGLVSNKLSARKIGEIIGTPGSDLRKRMDLLLGDKTLTPVKGKTVSRMDVVEALRAFLAPSEATQDAFKALGGLSAGAQLQLLYRDIATYAGRFAEKAVLASLYTSSWGRKFAANQVFSPEKTAVIANALIASEPIIRNLIETFGDEKARAIVSDMKRGIDAFVSKGESPNQAELNKFLQGKPAKTKTTTTP